MVVLAVSVVEAGLDVAAVLFAVDDAPFPSGWLSVDRSGRFSSLLLLLPCARTAGAARSSKPRRPVEGRIVERVNECRHGGFGIGDGTGRGTGKGEGRRRALQCANERRSSERWSRPCLALCGPVCEEEAWVEESGAAGGAGRR
jgi:hypothetical protein